MTGVMVPIKREPETVTGHILAVGQTRLLPETIRKRLLIGKKLIVANPQRDAFVVSSAKKRAGPGILFLAGYRGRGTIFAVYDFLESLGCRWFFACKAGECIPRTKRIVINAYDVFKQPDFAFRRHYTWDGPRSKETWKRERAWFEANKMSDKGPKEIGSGHNFGAIWPKTLFKTHPEYFPLLRIKPGITPPEQPGLNPLATGKETELGLDDGKGAESKLKWARVPAGHRCLSNPGLHQVGIAWALKTMAEHPDYDMVPFIQSDGSSHCQLDECTCTEVEQRKNRPPF